MTEATSLLPQSSVPCCVYCLNNSIPSVEKKVFNYNHLYLFFIRIYYGWSKGPFTYERKGRFPKQSFNAIPPTGERLQGLDFGKGSLN